MSTLLVIKLGSTRVPQRGDFAQLIGAAAAVSPRGVAVVDPIAGQPLPDPRTVGGVVLTGSAAMVTDRLPWSERTAEWLRDVVAAGTPLLGICYGHQLLAYALGGRVERNPRGREVGTVEVALTAAAGEDPLFAGLPSPLLVQATHLEAVTELPPAARLLAGNAADPHQAFAVGARAWGMQFHPEFDAEVMRGYIASFSDTLRGEGSDARALASAARDSAHGALLLQRFAALLGERHDAESE